MQLDGQPVNAERTRFPTHGLWDYRVHTLSVETYVRIQDVCDQEQYSDSRTENIKHEETAE